MKKPLYIVLGLALLTAVTVGYQYAHAYIYGSSLVAWYNMDSNSVSGTSLTDNSGSGNTGTLVNSPTQVTGKIGQALSFNGSSQYVALPNNTPYDANAVGTISAWIYPTSNVQQYILTAASPTLGPEDLVDFALVAGTASPRLAFQGYYAAISANNNVETPDNSIPLNKWSHVVVESNGSTWSMYINGVQQTVTPFWGSNTGQWFSLVNSGTVNNRIAYGTSKYSYPFHGSIDDVRIYNRALSAAEVQQLYYQTQGTHGGPF